MASFFNHNNSISLLITSCCQKLLLDSWGRSRGMGTSWVFALGRDLLSFYFLYFILVNYVIKDQQYLWACTRDICGSCSIVDFNAWKSDAWCKRFSG